MAEGLDVLLATLLLAKRVHVENLSLLNAEKAHLELSGEAVQNGLAALAQYMTLAPQPRVESAPAAPEEEAEKPAPPPTAGLWTAVKNFALPPLPQQQPKKRSHK